MQGFSDNPKHMDSAIEARKASCTPLEVIHERFWARLNESARRDIVWMNTGVREKVPVPQSQSKVQQIETTERISASIDKMGDMYRGGSSLQKIADRFKLHASTVHNNLLKAGVMMRTRGACRP